MSQRKQVPKDTGPRSGYREEQPRDRDQAQQPSEPAQPSPDEPGIERESESTPERK